MTDGRVSVNGKTVLDLGSKADPDLDEIRVDGRRIKGQERPRYLLLNKPRGYVTTRMDPQKRPTVIELLRGVKEYVYPVGRLDYDSEGLLILTNDGDLAAKLTHPRHEVERVYEARVRGIPDDRALSRLTHGIVLDGRRTAPAQVRLARLPASDRAARSEQSTLIFSIREGRNRQIRNMCLAVGHPVLTLRRVRIGPITDDRLPLGDVRELSAREVAALKKAVAATASGPGPDSGPGPSGPDTPARRGSRPRTRPRT